MTPERPGFRSDIEGLRGIAILLVVAFHAGVTRLAGGYVGVDVFFVLSGYLITGILAREVIANGDVNLPEFYSRRAKRLLPVFLVVLLATLVLSLVFYAPIDVPRIASDGRAVALHYGNVLFAQQAVNYHGAGANPFLHTWSLAVEEQFYVVWPLLFAFVGRFYSAPDAEDKTARRLLIAVVLAGVLSFALSVIVTDIAQPWAFFGMPTRIWEFALGGAAALVITTDTERRSGTGLVLQIAGFVAIAFATLTYHDALPYPGAAALLPALGALAIIVGGFLAPESPVSRALSADWLQWLGKMSYGWYLWHWPLVGLGAAIDYRVGVVGKLLWSVAALGLAILTHRFVEEPMRDNQSFREEPHRLNLVALGASVGAALLAWGFLLVATSRVSSPAQKAFARARDDGMNHGCWGSYQQDAKPCVIGDANGATTVVLMGDSHAEHWSAAMDRIGKERGWKVHVMVKPGCPVADIPALLNSGLKRPYFECNEWRRKSIARILELKPDIAVLSSFDRYVMRGGGKEGWGVTPAMWGAGLRRTYSVLSSAGIRTIAMRDVPDIGFDAPGCLSRNASLAPVKRYPCEYDYKSRLTAGAVREQQRAVAGLPNVALLSMNDRVCSGSPCRVVQRGVIVYRDDDHLTATFSRAEAPVLGARIMAAISSMPAK
jgi:peptidoglycan/LPS O-acetylase OafA/YrhL